MKKYKIRFGLLIGGLLLPIYSSNAEQITSSAVATNDGVLAFNEGKYPKAQEYFLQQLTVPDKKNEALIYLSRIAANTGDSDKAVDYIVKALSVAPNNVDEVILSGDLYCASAQQASMFSALGLAKKCIAQYEAAIEQEPKNIKALAGAIGFYVLTPAIAGGSKEKGEALLVRLRELSPENAGVLQVQLFLQNNQKDQAVALALELKEKGVKSAQNQYGLARFFRDNKMYAESRALLEPLMKTPETIENKWFVTDSLLQLGEALLLENKDLTRSIELIELYKTKNTNPKDVHYFWSTWSLAKVYKAMGNIEKYNTLVAKIKSEKYKEDKYFAKEFESVVSKG